MEVSNKPKLIAIIGPTSSGKTALSLQLARKYGGEVVSVDSRQVYRRLDIGTSKVTQEEQADTPHHLIDVIDPDQQMSVAEYKALADQAIKDTSSRGKVPLLVGGSPLYAYSVIDNYSIPEIPANPGYRAKLEAMDSEERLALLESCDPATFEIIDKKNPRRVIRALEVVEATGRSFSELRVKGEPQYDSLMIGITRSREELYQRIDQSVDERMTRGLVDEVRGLRDSGITDERLMAFGLEYRFICRYLKGELTLDEALSGLKSATHDFARRQMTWFGKDSRIHWIASEQEADMLVKKHLSANP